MANRNRQHKETREREFVDAVEQILGFPLFPWQRELLLEIRKATAEGRPIEMGLEYVRGKKNEANR